MNKIDTNNMKSTWPRVGHPAQPIFQLLTLGFRIGGNANFRVGVVGKANFSVFRMGSIFGKRDLLAIDHIMLALFWSYVPNRK